MLLPLVSFLLGECVHPHGRVCHPHGRVCSPTWASVPPTWASVVRGGAATCVGEPASPRTTPPSASVADFLELYGRCMDSGLKARVAVSHATGSQTITLMCILPASTTTAATAGRRRCCLAAAADGAALLPPLQAAVWIVRHCLHWMLLPQPAKMPHR
jgi:hypothetical protein